jgi:hypothetical protein
MRMLKLVFAGVLAFAALPAWANHLDQGTSGHGVQNSNCATDASDPACVQFTMLTATTGDFKEFNSEVLDKDLSLFVIPTTESVTFQLTNAAADFGTFFCGDDANSFTDSTGTALAGLGFCTNIPNGADPNSFLSSNPDTADSKGRVTYGFIPGASGLPADWVFYITAGEGNIFSTSGGGSSAPEPLSLALLGTGLFGLVGIIRRRRSKA